MARSTRPVTRAGRKITVQVLNWKRFNPRSDVKTSSWFRMDHSILDSPDFIDFNWSYTHGSQTLAA